MRKLTLLSLAVLVGMAITTESYGQLHKFMSKPNIPLQPSQTVIDQMYVPTNVPMTNVRIGVYIKCVYYSSLRLEITAPSGDKVRLKNAQAVGTWWGGSIGSDQSYTLFMDGGAAMTGTTTYPGTQPNDIAIAPVTPFSALVNKSSMGWWTLQIIDEQNSNVIANNGMLVGWVVMFNSVVVEPELAIWSQEKIGSDLYGILNGQLQVIPNQAAGADRCGLAGTNPNVTRGVNGDSYPFIVNIPSYPGLKIGAVVPGFTSPGRWKVTVSVATNIIPPVVTARNSDIAVYFGKSAVFNPPLQNPPAPKPVGVIADWPTGSGGTTPSLLPGPSSLGGIRLASCGQANGWPLGVALDVGGFIDVGFDDNAVASINAATICGGTGGSGICGPYRPQQPLSGFAAGTDVDGLYYVSVYDTFGETAGEVPGFGHIRVLKVRLDYLAGGGTIGNPLMHQGITGPLMGIPAPGAITGALAGYLPAVVSTIPPHSIHAKYQDPIWVMWATEKLYNRPTTGYERIQFVTPNNTIPPSGIGYHGPYAYNATQLDPPTGPRPSVNADLRAVPPGDYKIRLNLMQQRDDNDNSDNQFESYPFTVSNTTQAYYGSLIPLWNDFQRGALTGGQVAPFPFGPGTQFPSTGMAFTVFKNPTSKVSSIDVRFDQGFLGSGFPQTLRGSMRISIFRCANGFFGAPVTPRVAMSPTVAANEFFPGNWRTFPIYAADGQGAITTNPSVDLSPGTYVVMVEVLTANVLIYPYTYGALHHLTDRYRNSHFSEAFGPLGPFSQTGNRFQYVTNITVGDPPSAQTISQIWSYANAFGNVTWPIRMNFTEMNDFGINYVAFSGVNGPETIALPSAPFTPGVSVTANSLQGGLQKDFNVRLEIFDGNNSRVYLHDSGPVLTNGYQTQTVMMAQWNPSVGGMYKVKAWFSRNPDDQNPVNDNHEYYLYVSNTRAYLATGQGVSENSIDHAVSTLRSQGIDVEVMKSTDPRIGKASKNTDIYLLGSMDATSKNLVAAALQSGNEVAFVYDKDAKVGSVLKQIDYIFEVDRGPNADYGKMNLFPPIQTNTSAGVTPVDPNAPYMKVKATNKEELFALLPKGPVDINDAGQHAGSGKDDPSAYEHLVPAPISSGYGEIGFIDKSIGDLGISFAIPSVRKAVPSVKVDQTAPVAFALDQNYPNPFNPSTVISYVVADESVVTLRVLDLLGREVATLVNGSQKAGSYAVSWKGLDQSGAEVASGSYMYRLDATPTNGGQPFTSIKRMMLSK